MRELGRIKTVTKSLIKAREDQKKLLNLIARLESSRDKLKSNSEKLEKKINDYLGYWQAGYGEPVTDKKELERMIAAVGRLPKLAKPEQVAKALE